MQRWVRIVGALALAGFVLDGAAADTDKGARGGAGTTQPSTEDQSDDEDKPVEALSVEGWDGGAYYDDYDDEYYCEVSDEYGEGVTIWFGWDVDGLYMTIDDPNTFDLETFVDVDATVSIDDFYRQDFKAFSFGPDTLDFVIGHDRTTIEAIRRGEKMTVYPWDHWYTLHGLARALQALEDCYNRYS
jgi:hypothetical protein